MKTIKSFLGIIIIIVDLYIAYRVHIYWGHAWKDPSWIIALIGIAVGVGLIKE